MNTTKSPEFDGWRWVSFWYPVRQVVSFKKDVYRKAMKEGLPQVMFGNEKHCLENSQEHETNKPYHAPRKMVLNIKNVRFINQGAIMLTFILLFCLSGLWLVFLPDYLALVVG